MNMTQEEYNVRRTNASRLLYRLKKESSITISSDPDHTFEVSLALEPGEAVNFSADRLLIIYEAEGKYWTDEKIAIALYTYEFFIIWEEVPIDPFTWQKDGYYVNEENVDKLERKICKFLGIPIPKTVFERFFLLTALFYSSEGMEDCAAMLDYFGISYDRYIDDVD